MKRSWVVEETVELVKLAVPIVSELVRDFCTS